MQDLRPENYTIADYIEETDGPIEVSVDGATRNFVGEVGHITNDHLVMVGNFKGVRADRVIVIPLASILYFFPGPVGPVTTES